MGLKQSFDNLPLPARKEKLARLIAADDAAGVAQFLSQHPAAIAWKTPGNLGQLYVFEAINARKFAAADALLDGGTPVYASSIDEAPPLLHALRAANRHGGDVTAADLAFAEKLLARGANATNSDRRGRNILQRAAEVENIEAVKFLLHHGAEPTKALQALGTFKDYLSRDWARELLPVLLQAGADPNVTNNWGVPPLFCVQDVDTAKALVAHGANPEHTDGHGFLPWQMVRDKDVSAYLQHEVEERVAKRAGAAMMGDEQQAAAFEKDVEAAVHGGVAVKGVKRITLKPKA